ncbi:ferric reductase like transmembrane component [Colletotrichum graminicola M1.001]|uniref:Ferric reductase like transmembrane component n=1 Tax=Colletotrichum graminicola (strain M1.001 / M2 / FGSC 10212) TaxID=645133 RepID=E3QPU2_COLGM|nr:ferric reductase like transmembrane component [Colletotrichum graminicola M1.001]EFQ32869.1 ferric reductase like transmembrane component [Colletotrichum graminicola M1.001]
MEAVDFHFEDSLIDPYDEGLHGVNQSDNIAFVQILWASLGLLTSIVVSVQLVLHQTNSRRRIALAEAPKETHQDAWVRPVFPWVPGVKRRFLYAPLFSLRRARRLHWFGSLSTRSHAIFLLFYAASNIAYMFAVNFDSWTNRYTGGGEHGPAGPSNRARQPHNGLVAVELRRLHHASSLDCPGLTFYAGRTVVLEILLHGIVWAVVHVADKGWSSVGVKVVHHDFIRAGFVGWVALALILVLSLPPVRAACYEALVNIHILLATIIIGSTIAHCKLSGFDLPHTPWNIAAAVLWAVERLLRALRLVRYSLTRQGRTITDIETIEGTSNMCRITMNLPCRVDIKPGTHAYIRLGAVKFRETHPFSMAWVEHRLYPTARGFSQRKITTVVSFIVCAQQGFTRDLFNRVSASGGVLTTNATFKGPYGGHTSLDSYGHVVLIAGASGITHQIGYARRLVLGFNSQTTATRRIVLVWVI